MALLRPIGLLGAPLLACSMQLGCTESQGSLFVATPTKIHKREVKPERRRAALLGCVATNALFVSTGFPEEVSDGEIVRLAWHTGGCYDELVADVAADRAVSAEERAAIALAAERSVLAVDPDPKTRLERAARIAGFAAQALAEKGDARAVDAHVRAAWYAARAATPDLAQASDELWADVHDVDVQFARRLAAERAAFNARLAQTVSAVRSAVIAGASANMTPAQRQRLEQQERLQQTIADATVAVARFSAGLARSRADLDVLLRSGLESLPVVMPELERRFAPLKGWAVARDLVETLDAARRNDAGAKERLVARIAESFGAKVSLPEPVAPPEPVASAPLPEPSSPAPATPAAPAALPPAAPAAPRSAAQRIRELEELLKEDLITQSEFDERKKQVLEEVVK